MTMKSTLKVGTSKPTNTPIRLFDTTSTTSAGQKAKLANRQFSGEDIGIGNTTVSQPVKARRIGDVAPLANEADITLNGRSLRIGETGVTPKPKG